MHRQTRRFLLGLTTVAACLVVAGLGIRWIFSSEPTELTGRVAHPQQSTSTREPGLRPLLPASAAPAEGKVQAELEKVEAAGEADGGRKEPALTEIPSVASKPKVARGVPTPPATQPGTPRLSAREGEKELEAGFAALDRKELVAARTYLNNALHSGLSPADEKRVREALADLAQQTIFSRSVLKDDPLTERHTIKSGESLARIARRYKISENLLAEINGITNKNLIRAGSTLKVIHGPFHASVVKSQHKLHVYLQDVYVRTYRVALGMDGSTPTGTWKVINQLENPDWVDPQGKRWHADDPKNPIGEFWIGLEGIEGDAVGKVGFGIHGTVEPETIGQDVSLGCVRLAADDIAALYKFLVPGASITTIVD
ncbi:MAG TPA: L,D-transpeptidase family protein [Phycisphaerae bacterium]|nr:L,D-transpeptidase family protein [Phycisphaerae bacterium]HOQ85437.1 L,D-transpeptidase family protein [Phycisphaerae bacterium]HQA00006.1 L,D-transpeptidase family protein [Phycisphaerae bacterium]